MNNLYTVMMGLNLNGFVMFLCDKNSLTFLGHVVAKWLRHYATSLKITGSRPYEVNEFFQFT
jgi:hypothetical protein